MGADRCDWPDDLDRVLAEGVFGERVMWLLSLMRVEMAVREMVRPSIGPSWTAGWMEADNVWEGAGVRGVHDGERRDSEAVWQCVAHSGDAAVETAM